MNPPNLAVQFAAEEYLRHYGLIETRIQNTTITVKHRMSVIIRSNRHEKPQRRSYDPSSPAFSVSA